MAVDPTGSELLDRHRAFWNRDPGSLLLNRVPRRVYQPRPFPRTGGSEINEPTEFAAKDLDLDRFVGVSPVADSGPYAGDLVGWAGPVFPEAWMGAILGCRIFPSAFGCTARPVATGSIAEILAMGERAAQGATSSPWYGAMMEMLKVSAEVAGRSPPDASSESATFPVRQPHLRGVVDMTAAFLGEERLCLEAIDHPSELRTLAEVFADLWIDVALATRDRRPRWNGGCVSTWKVFAPDVIADYQIDASSILSPTIYREVLLPADTRIYEAFPYSIVHLHAVGLHHLDSVLESSVTAVEINLDRETGNWDRNSFVNCCTQIQQAGKGLVLVGELSDRDIEVLLGALERRGLAIDSWRETVQG